MCSSGSNRQYIIDSGSGLVPIRQQAIIWTNDGFDHNWCIYVTRPLEMVKFLNVLMINNFSIFCDNSLSKYHKIVNIDSSNGLAALHNKPFPEQKLTTVW